MALLHEVFFLNMQTLIWNSKTSFNILLLLFYSSSFIISSFIWPSFRSSNCQLASSIHSHLLKWNAIWLKFIFGWSSSFVLVHFKWTFYCRVRSVEFRSIIGNSIRNKSRLDSNPCWNVELDFFCKVHLEECTNSAKKLARNEFEVWRPGRWSARNVPLPRTGRIKAQRRWTAILKRSARQFQQSSNFTFKFLLR